MPTSRKRKKKKAVKKNKMLSMEEIKDKMKSSGVAPDPIKMQYFEANFSSEIGSTFEERLETLKKIGRDAAEAFPEKYKNIQGWFKKYDQLKLLAFSFYYFMTSPAGYDEEATTGGIEFLPYYQELLQAFALTLPQTFNPQPFSQEVPLFKEDFKKIGELNRLKYFDFPDTIKNADELPFHLLRTEMMMHTTAVRNWSYDHKMKDVTLSLAERIKNDFIKYHGFDPVIFIKMLYNMVDVVEERINEHRLKTVEFLRQKNYNQLFDTYEKLFPVEKLSEEKRREMWNVYGKKLDFLKSILLMHSDLFLEGLFTFDFVTLSSYVDGKLSIDQLKNIFAQISFKFEELAATDAEKFLLNNPIHEKPFIRVSEETIFSSLWSILTHLSIGILEFFCAKDEKLRKKYNDARAIYLEDQVSILFKNAFPMAEVFTGSKWKGEDGKEYENDLLVIIDKFALIIEAKAGMVSPPAKRGAPDRLFKTLQELIEDPSTQALRFIEFLKKNPKELSLKVKKGPNNRFDATSLKYFIPLGVTLSHLGMTSTNLKRLIQAGVTNKPIEELATSISLTDLEIVFDLLPKAAEKIHYLQRRRELEASIEYSGDELDLLAWYMDHGFNLGSDTEKYGYFQVELKSKELDNYIIGSARNEKVKKPELKKTKWWNDMLQRLEEKQFSTWLETSYILLNVPIDMQQGFEGMVKEMKAMMRNGTAKQQHNWILIETWDKKRQFTIAGYGYHIYLNEERDNMIGEILYDKMPETAKGKLVIGLNIENPNYPYNVLGCWLSSDLFDNLYLKMLKTDENSLE